MQEAVKAGSIERRLVLGELLDWLVEDGLADAEVARMFKKERRYYKGTVHPLAVVADQKWKSGSKILDLDMLSEWLAKRVGFEYFHIDPLKIDFTGVTELMS